jgi:DNA-binding transcriptional regulator of glucitol operon
VSRVLLTPRWLALHVLAVALVVTCGVLSYWQFLRAEAGNGRSLGYALQWPGFGVFVIGVWFWLARDAARSAAGGGSAAAPAEPPRVEPVPGRAPDDVVLPPAPSTAAERAAAGPGDTGADATGDDELAAFNRLLARLHERDTT